MGAPDIGDVMLAISAQSPVNAFFRDLSIALCGYMNQSGSSTFMLAEFVAWMMALAPDT
jgi:hypothetical protein